MFSRSCSHGLPIELKVLQSMKDEERKSLTPIKLRQEAAKFAAKTVDSQREQFKRYGKLPSLVVLTPLHSQSQ